MKNIYDKVNAECQSLLSDKSTKCRPIFLCPLGTEGQDIPHSTVNVCGRAIKDLDAIGKPIVVIIEHTYHQKWANDYDDSYSGIPSSSVYYAIRNSLLKSI